MFRPLNLCKKAPFKVGLAHRQIADDQQRSLDHLDDSRSHTGAGVLRDHEGKGLRRQEP